MRLTFVCSSIVFVLFFESLVISRERERGSSFFVLKEMNDCGRFGRRAIDRVSYSAMDVCNYTDHSLPLLLLLLLILM